MSACGINGRVADRHAMLSKRGGEVLYLGLLTLAIAGVCGLVLSIAWFGLDGRLFSRWIRAALVGWVAAFPCGLLIAGWLRRVAGKLVG